MKELALIAEMHSDVLATPESQLIMALDYVKAHELNGEPYDIADYGKVSLGLKKFLSSSKDEQIKCYERETRRLEIARADAALQKEQADRNLIDNREVVAGMERQLHATSREKAMLEARVAADARFKNRLQIAAWSATMIIAAAVALQRDAVLAGASISVTRATGLLADALCILLLGLASRSVIRLVAKPEHALAAFCTTSGVVVATFLLIRDFDPERLNNVIDFAARFSPFAVFFFQGRR